MRVSGATVIEPDVGRTRPASRLSSVLLPLPLGPTSAVDVPGSMRNELGARATTDP